MEPEALSEEIPLEEQKLALEPQKISFK